MQIKQRVFMVGCPRSGTTILQAALAAHHEIASFPETHFFPKAVQQYRRRFGFRRGPRYAFREMPRWKAMLIKLKRDLTEDFKPTVLAHPAANKLVKRFVTNRGRPELMRLFPRRSQLLGPKVRGLVKILDRLALDQNKTIWLEKTPVHVLYLDVIEKYIPGSKIVHVIRPGPDVVASIVDAKTKYQGWRKDKSRPINLLRAVRLWNRCQSVSKDYRNAPNHLTVHYADFVREPERVLRDICAFIGIEFEPAMLLRDDVDVRSIGRSIGADTPSKSSIAKGIAPPEDKFSKLFTAEQQSYILEHLVETI